MSGQAVAGVITQAMFDTAQQDQKKWVAAYDYTLNSKSPAFKRTPVPFNATFGITRTKVGAAVPYQLTYARVLEALDILGFALSWQVDLNQLKEWDFDCYLSAQDNSSFPRAEKLIARGSITQPPQPLQNSGQSIATA
ncbi:MAG: hypothetical protein Q9166_000490 [cf. Caloplaca sp. 2 TL-2023]